MPEGFNLGSAYATIEIDSSGIAAGMNKAKSGISAGISGITSVISTAATAFAVVGGAAAAFGGLAIKSFSDSQVVVAQLDAVLKSTGSTAGVTRDMALDLASGFQKVTRFSDETVLSAENMLLTFTDLGKDVFPDATKTVLDMSQALGQDTKSSAIQLGKALNDPIKGITALTRVGVTFTQAQKDAIAQMVKMGNTAGAQKLILQELQKEFGGSAEAAGRTFAGQLDILRNKIDDFMETIGEKLLPVVTSVLEGLNKGLTTFFDAISDGVNPLEALGMALFNVFGEGIRPVAHLLKRVGEAFQIFFGMMAQGEDPIRALGDALSGAFYDNPFLSSVGDLLYSIGTAIAVFVNQLRSGINPITSFVAALFAAFGDNPVTQGIRDFLYSIRTFVDNLISSVQTFVQNNPAFLVAMGGIAAVLGVAAIVAAALPPIIALITGAVGLLTGALGVLLSPAVILIGVITGIVYAASQLYPGGLVKLFKDAQQAALQLATLGLGVLNAAADWTHSKFQALIEILNRFIAGVQGISGIINLLSSGQVNIGDVVNATLNGAGGPVQPIAAGTSTGSSVLGAASNWFDQHGPAPIPPVGGGSSLPISQQPHAGQGLAIENIHVYANDAAGGKAAGDAFAQTLEDRFRGRGN